MISSRFSAFYLHERVMRTLMSVYRCPFKAIESTLLTHDWQIAHGRDFGAADLVGSWSGARGRWKLNVRRGIGEGIEVGFLELRAGVRSGSSLFITAKGFRLIADYRKELEGLNERLEAKREIFLVEKAAKLAKKRERVGKGKIF